MGMLEICQQGAKLIQPVNGLKADTRRPQEGGLVVIHSRQQMGGEGDCILPPVNKIAPTRGVFLLDNKSL